MSPGDAEALLEAIKGIHQAIIEQSERMIVFATVIEAQGKKIAELDSWAKDIDRGPRRMR